MVLLTTVGVILDSTPVARRLWRWILERNMEVELHSANHRLTRTGLHFPDDGPHFVIHDDQKEPDMYAWFDVVLINHRTDRHERIRDGAILLQRRWLGFWRRTIAIAPLVVGIGGDSPPGVGERIQDIELRPISSPITLTCQAFTHIALPKVFWPNRLEVVLEFRMIGPMRRYRHVIQQWSKP